MTDPLPPLFPDDDDEQALLSKRQKQVYREAALKRREDLGGAAREVAARTLAAQAFPLDMQPGAIVAGYFAMRSELDPMPLMLGLRERGARLALPVVAGRDLPLIFRAWQPGDALASGPFGLSEPLARAQAVDPDIVLVPLTCFDRHGHRIGYGAGHYDRTLAGLRRRKPIVAIGLAFSVQEIKLVPATPFDETLDAVWTDKEWIGCRGG